MTKAEGGWDTEGMEVKRVKEVVSSYDEASLAGTLGSATHTEL